MKGGQSGFNVTCTVSYTDGRDVKKYLIKTNEYAGMYNLTHNLREAWFYEIIVNRPELKQAGFNAPGTVVNILDTQSSKYVSFMELLDDITEVNQGLMDWYPKEEIITPTDQNDIKKLDADLVFKKLAITIAALHSSTWMDTETLNNAKSMLWNSRFILGED